MADSKIELELVLDDGSVKRAFATVRKEGEEAGKGFGDAFKVKGLADFTAGLFLVQQAANAVGASLKAAFDLALEGEQIAAIGKRFEILATQAGLSSESIATGVERAVAGTVDLEDALQASSRAIITLGDNARQIPQIFELARQASQAYGGTTLENFDKISQAIASGNTRVLRQVGIIVDGADAIKRYEQELGAASGGLTKAGEQQAILNAVLEKGSEAYKNINSSVAPLQQSYERLSVTTKELGDTGASLFNNLFGGVLQNAINNTNSRIQALNVTLSEALLGKVPTAREEIARLNEQIRELTISQDLAQVRGDIGRFEQLQTEIDLLRQKLLIQQSLDNQKATTAALDQQEIATSNQKLVQTMQLTDAMIAQNQVIDDYQKLLAKQVAATEQATVQINQAVKGALVNGIAQSVLAMVNAIAKGENALSAVGKTILGVFGDLAIQTGTILIGIGIGIESLKTLSGFAAIAAGIGLVAIGGILKALSGGEGSNAGVTSTGGGVAFTGDSQAIVQQNQEQALERTANTAVNLTVQGDVLDSDATSLRIVDLLNSALDKQGVTVRTGFA